ncbi:MAG: hypothetical protein AAGB22_08230 [Bacteroidota bacterium]
MKAFDDLERLLATKEFDALTADERALVEAHIGPKETYEAMRAVHHCVPADDPGLEPDPGTLLRLQGMFPAQPEAAPVKKHGLSALWALLFSAKHLGIKTGLVAAALAGPVLFHPELGPFEDPLQSDTAVYVTDTFHAGGDSSSVRSPTLSP